LTIGAKVCKIPQAQLQNRVDLEKTLQNASTLAIVAVHSAENEPPKVLEKSGEICIQITAAAAEQRRACCRTSGSAYFWGGVPR